MQPPPRKVKHTTALKNVHAEQIAKLQHKHQQEIDLLEDIRLFSKQRSTIEKEYAQALCKLAQQFMSKSKAPPPPVLPSEDGQDYKVISEVWRTVLEETDRVGRVRLQAADTMVQHVSEPCKPLKTAKTQVAKKVFDQLSTVQKEVAQTVLEFTKAHKVYSDEEHISHDARFKAAEAESKVKNKSTGLFTSMAKLQQNSAKLSSRRDGCETKSTASRNEYILSLAATNAHQERYYTQDLTELIQMLDGDMFDKVREFFMTVSRTEVDCCGQTQERFMKILTDSTMISRQYNLRCFLHDNLVFTNKVQYSLEPQDNDEVTKVSFDHLPADSLTREAQKWAVKLAREDKAIRDNRRCLEGLEGALGRGQSPEAALGEAVPGRDSGPASPTLAPADPEIRAEELRQNIRKAETGRLKAEARLKALQEGGVKVDEWLSRAQAECQREEEEEAARRAKGKDSQSEPDGKVAPQEQKNGGHQVARSSVGGVPNDSTYINYEEDDFDETFLTTAATSPLSGRSPPDNTSTGYGSAGRNFPIACSAIYDFEANNADELSLKENEAVEVIGDGDGDGWVQARGSTGKVGFVPENYLLMPGGGCIDDPNEMNVDHDAVSQANAAGSPPSAGYDSSAPPSAGYETSAPPSAGYETSAPPSAGYETSAPPSAGYDSSAPPSAGYETSAPPSAGYESSAPPSAGYDTTSAPPSAGYDTTSVPTSAGYESSCGSGGEHSAAYTEADYEVQSAVRPHDMATDGPWARALYAYEANSAEELTFQEGTLIRIIRKDENGVDDGWWEGEVGGRMGVFPSLVVEEIAQDSSLKNLSSPDRPGPPAFTPPDLGPPPPHLEITQPTPSDESGPEGHANESAATAKGSQSGTEGEAPPPSVPLPSVPPPPETSRAGEGEGDTGDDEDWPLPPPPTGENDVVVVTAEVHQEPSGDGGAVGSPTSGPDCKVENVTSPPSVRDDIHFADEDDASESTI